MSKYSSTFSTRVSSSLFSYVLLSPSSKEIYSILRTAAFLEVYVSLSDLVIGNASGIFLSLISSMLIGTFSMLFSVAKDNASTNLSYVTMPGPVMLKLKFALSLLPSNAISQSLRITFATS